LIQCQGDGALNNDQLIQCRGDGESELGLKGNYQMVQCLGGGGTELGNPGSWRLRVKAIERADKDLISLCQGDGESE